MLQRPPHTRANTHACTQDVGVGGEWVRLSLHMQIYIIDLSPALAAHSHILFFIFNEGLVDLAAQY